MTEFKADVSVIIPCYNSERYIEACLQSVISQTLPVTEILIYDDCSSDRSLSIIKEKYGSFSYIHIIAGEKNIGAAGARNVLLDRARCQYIAFLDADDVWEKNKIELQYNSMIDADADICVGSYTCCNFSSKKISKRYPPKRVTFLSMHLANWIPNSFTMLNRRVCNDIRFPNIHARHDYAFYLKIFEKEKNVKYLSLNENMGLYRVSNSGLSGGLKNKVFNNYKMFRQIMKYGILSSLFFVSLNAFMKVVKQ